ncbi:MAG: succinate dehydrogenase, hydrophobic membrane anchor protein [bacterium]|nr:succinate dehydrogenase, hydrophobic membrane anchor protein [bacterium]
MSFSRSESGGAGATAAHPTGSYGWLFQRVSGVALFVLVLVHFVLMHCMGAERRLYADVMARLSNPLWKTFDLALLALALSHGWYGAWGIVQDCVRPAGARVALLVLIAAAALALFCLGLVTILAVRP